LEAFYRDVPELRALQDRLGRWHDLKVLSELVDEPESVIEQKKREWSRAQRLIVKTLPRAQQALKLLEQELKVRH